MSIIPALEDPLPAYSFVVSLDPSDGYSAAQIGLTLVAAGQFSQVSGLGADLEVLAYGEGGRNDYTHQLPVRHSYPRIVLRRGMIRDPGLYFWYQAGLTASLGARRDGAIVMLTPAGIPAVGWIFAGGLAVAWRGPEFRATDSAIAIESIEIAHEGLQQVPLTPPGVNAL